MAARREALGAKCRAVVGKHTAHGHSEVGEVAHASTQEVAGTDASLVGLQLAVAKARVVVDRHEQIFPTCPIGRVVPVAGNPVPDNGPEFVSKAILEWLTGANIDIALIDPGKPWQSGDNESFNGKFRDECLSMEWFRSRTEARVVIEIWRRHYNAVRPHSSLDYRTPSEFRRHHESTHQGAIVK